ncbi:MAG: DNA repair protein RecO [Bacillota bacterium]|nr:DNA repair protein RecO [Bacillota bacterium]
MNLKVKGFVIKETAVGESDKVLTVLAQGLGKIQAWARGSRRLKSPLMAASQCFTYADFTLFKNKDTYSVNQAEIIAGNFELRKNIETLALASYITELAGKVVQENAADDEILKLTLNTLYLLGKGDRPAALIKSVYELRLMMLSGFMPELHDCVLCGGEIEKPLYFDSAAGGVVCESCREKDGDAVSVSPSVYKALCRIMGEEGIFSFSLSDHALSELSVMAEAFVLMHTDFAFKTLDFYKTLC